MDTKDSAYSALIALAVSLLVVGGYAVHQYLPDDPAPNYKCESLMIQKYCDHLSASGGRCYPTTTTKGYKDCSSGWVLIDYKQYEQPEITNSNGKNWCCNPKECYPKTTERC